MLLSGTRLISHHSLLRTAQVRHGSFINVILLQNIEGRGKVGETVSVKRGYARNLLVPRKMAVYATAENKVRYLPAAEGKDPTSPRSKFGEALVSLAKEKLVVERLASPGGVLYDPLTANDIAFELNKLNIGVFASNIYLQPTFIKKPGQYKFTVDGLHFNFDVVPLSAVGVQAISRKIVKIASVADI